MINDSNKEELNGAKAVEFARKHLKEIKSNPDTWETEYICEDTGERWLMVNVTAVGHLGCVRYNFGCDNRV
jgi:hypothetical protein